MTNLSKTTSTSGPMRNAIGTLIVGSFLFAAALFLTPQIQHTYESLSMPKEPIHMELELRTNVFGVTEIHYRAVTKWPVSAEWIGQTRSVHGKVFCTDRSPDVWPYDIGHSTLKPWTWAAWWQYENSPAKCTEPIEPYVLCGRYVGFGMIAGLPFSTSWRCSGPYFPKGEKA